MEKKHIIEFDYIKGIAILLVVMGHVIQHNNLQGGVYNPVYEFINSFHMPLFFIVSGSLTALRTNTLNGTFLELTKYNYKKIISLIIPFLVWGLIINTYFFSEKFQLISIKEIISYIKYPGNTWFLQKLFEIYCIYSISRTLTSRIISPLFNGLLLLATSLSINILLYFIVDRTHYLSVLLFNLFFYFGYFSFKLTLIQKYITKEWVLSLSIFVFSLLVVHWSYESTMIDKLLKIIISITAFIVLYNICKRIKWNPFISNLLSMWGRYSLAIYLIHFYFVPFLKEQSNIQFNINNLVFGVIVLCYSIPIIYICIFIAKIIETSSITNFIIFGKRKK